MSGRIQIVWGGHEGKDQVAGGSTSWGVLIRASYLILLLVIRGSDVEGGGR